MINHPRIEHHAVSIVPGREGLASLSTADHKRLGRTEPIQEGWIPYCHDEQTGSLIFATGLDAAAIAGRGMHYARLRAATRKIAVVPTDVVPDALLTPARRVYVFSPGRCGSTLLCQVLRAAGVPALAEPGFYLSILKGARGASTACRDQLRANIRGLENALLQPFGADNTVIIKPHPYCAHDLDLWLGDEPRATRPRTIALMRRIEPWSRSWFEFNQTDVVQDVALYILYLGQLSRLLAETDCLLVSYEALMEDPRQTVGNIAKHLGLVVDVTKVDAAMRLDSHAGDRLWARHAGPAGGAREALVNTVWRLQRPDALIERLGIGGLTD